MPRKKGQTQLPKASYTGKQARFRDLNVKQKDAPTFGGERVLIADCPLWFASYQWYRDGRRLLDPEEVWAMMQIHYGEKYRFNDKLFKQFDKPEDPLVIKIETLRSENEQVLCLEVDYLFRQLLKEKSAADRAKAYEGFIGRMPTADFMDLDTTEIFGKGLQPDQALTIYALVQLSNSATAREVYCREYDIDLRSGYPPQVFDSLANSNRVLTQRVGYHMKKYGLGDFFADKAAGLLSPPSRVAQRTNQDYPIQELSRSMTVSDLNPTASDYNRPPRQSRLLAPETDAVQTDSEPTTMDDIYAGARGFVPTERQEQYSSRKFQPTYDWNAETPLSRERQEQINKAKEKGSKKSSEKRTEEKKASKTSSEKRKEEKKASEKSSEQEKKRRRDPESESPRAEEREAQKKKDEESSRRHLRTWEL